MRYIIYGAGAIGGAIGARLHLLGKKVILIARGSHFEMLQSQGMTFRAPEGTQLLTIPTVNHPRSVDFSSDDIVFLTMKSQHSLNAIESLYAEAGADIPVICCQNGVANEFMASRHFSKTYAMVVLLPASHMHPGEVIHHARGSGNSPSGGILDTGLFPSGSDKTIEAVARDLRDAGFSAEVDDQVMRWKYAKLLQNLGNSLQAVTGLGGDTKEIMSEMIHEALACYRAANIECASRDELASRRADVFKMEEVEGVERGGGSSWQSLLRGTGSIEANYLNGEISYLGKLHGVPTPANETLRRLALEVAAEELSPGHYSVEQVRELIEQRKSNS